VVDVTTRKPSRPEGEFIQREQARQFAETQERERLARLQREQRERRALHFMKCPSCGSDLETKLFHTVEVGHCGACRGVWLNEAQLERLTGRESTLLRDILEFFHEVGQAKPISEM